MTAGLRLACTASAVFVRTHQVTEMLNDYKDITADLVGNPQFTQHQRRIAQWAVRWEQFLIDDAIETECGWEGDVETNIERGIVNWVCPGCGSANCTLLTGDDDRGRVAP